MGTSWSKGRKNNKGRKFLGDPMVDKLDKFYFHCLLPQIIDPRRRRNMPVREHDYILEVKIRKSERNLNVKIKGLKIDNGRSSTCVSRTGQLDFHPTLGYTAFKTFCLRQHVLEFGTLFLVFRQLSY